MPRLIYVNVLLDTVRKGVAAKTFALAADETLTGLQFGDVALGEISLKSFLVKAKVAQLEDLPDAKVSVRVVVNIDVPNSIATEIEETIAANCAELNVDNSVFEP